MIDDIDAQIAELQRKKTYLGWIAQGAKLGVLDLLAKDIAEENLKHIFDAAQELRKAVEHND